MKASATGDGRPKALPVVAANIPDQLKEISQWVTWRYELRDDKWTKPPYQATSTDRTTWSDFKRAMKTYQSRAMAGIGFVVSPDDDIIGIDLDHCFDPKTRKAEPWTLNVIQKMQSYSEFSPSGKGFRIFVKGSLPDAGRKKGNIEVYAAGRYFTVTGHRLKNAPLTIQPRQDEIMWLLETYFKEKAKPKPKPNGDWDPPSDQELLDRAFAAKNGDRLKQLFDGDISAYPSQSEADLALCSLSRFGQPTKRSSIDCFGDRLCIATSGTRNTELQVTASAPLSGHGRIEPSTINPMNT